MSQITKINESGWDTDANGKKWEDYDTIVCPNGQIIDMVALLDEQQRAKAALIHLQPFFGGFINKLNHVYTFRVKTQATDGINLFINPQFTASLDLTGKVFVMAHEIMHCVLNHMRRGKGHDPEKSNVAADYEVNITLADMGLIKIATMNKIKALVDKKYSGWGYEKIYADGASGNGQGSMNNQDQQNQAKQNQQQSQGQSGEGSQGQSDDSQPGSGEGQNQSGDGQSSGNSRTSKSDKNQGVVRPEDCVGPSDINGVPDTAGGMIDRDSGEKICRDEGYDDKGGSDSAVEREWKDAALKAASQLPGDGAGNLKAKLEAIYKVTTNWKKELRKVVGHSISPEDKRQAYANKNVLISQDRLSRTDKDKYDNLDYMMAWIDSSASMTEEQLKMCLSEIYGVALAKKPIKLVVIQCDTKIQEIKEYTDLRQLKRDMLSAYVKGGGGTELKPCWDLLMTDPKYKRRPAELVMIFTDGRLTQYKRNPRTMRNLCWAILDNPGWSIKHKDINTKAIYLNTADIK